MISHEIKKEKLPDTFDRGGIEHTCSNDRACGTKLQAELKLRYVSLLHSPFRSSSSILCLLLWTGIKLLTSETLCKILATKYRLCWANVFMSSVGTTLVSWCQVSRMMSWNSARMHMNHENVVQKNLYDVKTLNTDNENVPAHDKLALLKVISSSCRTHL